MLYSYAGYIRRKGVADTFERFCEFYMLAVGITEMRTIDNQNCEFTYRVNRFANEYRVEM